MCWIWRHIAIVTKLDSLHIHMLHVNLVGNIPMVYQSLNSLRQVNLSHTKIGGIIFVIQTAMNYAPFIFNHYNNCYFLQMPKHEGSISSVLKIFNPLPDLTTLDLSWAKFEGFNCYYSNSYYKLSVYLCSNSINLGTLPSTFSSFKKLQTLKLSNNKIIGNCWPLYSISLLLCNSILCVTTRKFALHLD
jgi:hypothetical protein